MKCQQNLALYLYMASKFVEMLRPEDGMYETVCSFSTALEMTVHAFTGSHEPWAREP